MSSSCRIVALALCGMALGDAVAAQEPGKQALEALVSEAVRGNPSFLREEMRLNHVRHDALEVLKNTPALPPAPQHPLSRVISKAA